MFILQGCTIGLLDSATGCSACKDGQLPQCKDDHEDDEAMGGGWGQPEGQHYGNEPQYRTCTCAAHHSPVLK